MKKLFSLLAVVLLCVSAMAGTVVFTADDFTGGAASPGAHMEASKSGVTVSTENGLVATDHIRVFGGGSYTLNFNASSTMTKIEFEWAAQGNKYDGPDTETPNATTFSVVATKQMRIATITVTINGEGGGTTGGGTTGGGTTGGGTTGGGTTGGGTTGGGTSTTLDPNYQYAEPTTIGVPELTLSAQAYEFVENNIKVNCTNGAVNTDYFSCYAGSAITFTAAKPIKGLTVNGYIKKDFTATASSGMIEYADASEAEVEGDPVLIMTNIDATSVTLTCVKQIRFYSVDFYFEENPDVELGGGGNGGDGEYTYEWEPTTPTTITATMDYAAAYDFAEDYGFVELYLENDDYFTDLYVLADFDAQLGVPAGTYNVASSGEPGTVWASSGGNEEEDEPSYLAADFDAEGYYNTSYYFAGGTLTVSASAKGVKYEMAITTHFGSTLNLTYEGPVENGFDTAVEQVTDNDEHVAATKILRNGQLLILRNGLRYTISGQKL